MGTSISFVVADALTVPSEVFTLLAAWVSLRAALVAFIALLNGKTPREIADATALAAAGSIPGAILIAIGCVLYLLLKQS